MTIQTAGFLLLGKLTVGTPYLTGLLPEMLIVSLGAALSFTAFNIAALSGARRGERPRFRAHQHVDAGRRPHRPRDSGDDSRRGGGQPWLVSDRRRGDGRGLPVRLPRGASLSGSG